MQKSDKEDSVMFYDLPKFRLSALTVGLDAHPGFV